MDRRAFVIVLAGLFAAVPGGESTAERGRQPAVIGILSPWLASESPTAAEAFRQGLSELGYTARDGVRLDYRSSEGHDDRLLTLAAELVAAKVDILVAATVPAIRAAQQATTTIPIVMMWSSDPVRLGLVQSLSRPGGNTTGMASLLFDLGAKRVEILKEAIPKLSRLAVLFNPTNPAVREGANQTAIGAQKLGVTARLFEMREPTHIDTTFAAILQERSDGLVVVPDAIMNVHAARIAELAAKNRIPSMWGGSGFTDAGGLISYGIDEKQHVRDVVRCIDKVIKGAKPADLPVEQPTKFWLVISLKTAKALGLTIPQSLLQRADQVIE